MEHGSPLRGTALVVDDDVFVLAAIADMLSEEGYDVHTASNGFSAIRHAADLRPDVMLLDLVLPERSGPEVLSELRNGAATRHAACISGRATKGWRLADVVREGPVGSGAGGVSAVATAAASPHSNQISP